MNKKLKIIFHLFIYFNSNLIFKYFFIISINVKKINFYVFSYRSIIKKSVIIKEVVKYLQKLFLFQHYIF